MARSKIYVQNFQIWSNFIKALLIIGDDHNRHIWLTVAFTIDTLARFWKAIWVLFGALGCQGSPSTWMTLFFSKCTSWCLTFSSLLVAGHWRYRWGLLNNKYVERDEEAWWYVFHRHNFETSIPKKPFITMVVYGKGPKKTYIHSVSHKYKWNQHRWNKERTSTWRSPNTEFSP